MNPDSPKIVLKLIYKTKCYGWIDNKHCRAMLDRVVADTESARLDRLSGILATISRVLGVIVIILAFLELV